MPHNKGYAITFSDEDGRWFLMYSRHHVRVSIWTQRLSEALIVANPHRARMIANAHQHSTGRGDYVRSQVHVRDFTGERS